MREFDSEEMAGLFFLFFVFVGGGGFGTQQ